MLKKRIVTGLIGLAVIFVVLFVLPANAATAFIGLLVLGGAWEWASFLGTDDPIKRAAFIALVAVLVLLAGLGLPALASPVLYLSLAWWLFALGWIFRFPTPIPVAFRWLAGVLVLVPLFVALVTLYESGPIRLLFALFVVWAADVGAYFAGRRFGHVKLAPAISPGKTWEGVFGGMLLVAVIALLFAPVLGLPAKWLIPFSVAVALLSIVGDLTVSMFKRTAGIKDSGKLFPGHGGILDRVDSVSAAAPVLALGLSWLGVGG